MGTIDGSEGYGRVRVWIVCVGYTFVWAAMLWCGRKAS